MKAIAIASLLALACGGTYAPSDAEPLPDATPDVAPQDDATPDAQLDASYGLQCVTDNSTTPPGEHIQCYDLNGNATWEWNETGGQNDWHACNELCIIGTRCRERGDAGLYFQGFCQ